MEEGQFTLVLGAWSVGKSVAFQNLAKQYTGKEYLVVCVEARHFPKELDKALAYQLEVLKTTNYVENKLISIENGDKFCENKFSDSALAMLDEIMKCDGDSKRFT
jgi:ABC-type enterochelin transport system ATPase subunit